MREALTIIRRLLGALKGRERGRADRLDRVAFVPGHGRGRGRGARRVAPRPRGRASGAGNDRILRGTAGARDARPGPRVPGAAGSIKKAKRNKAAASNDSAACLIEVKTGKAPPNESGALLPILTEDGKDHFLPGMRFGSSACLTTRLVRANSATALGMTMRLLNMSLSSQTRSLDIIVPRKMNTSARTV